MTTEHTANGPDEDAPADAAPAVLRPHYAQTSLGNGRVSNHFVFVQTRQQLLATSGVTRAKG